MRIIIIKPTIEEISSLYYCIAGSVSRGIEEDKSFIVACIINEKRIES